jgi:hypothetical protein
MAPGRPAVLTSSSYRARDSMRGPFLAHRPRALHRLRHDRRRHDCPPFSSLLLSPAPPLHLPPSSPTPTQNCRDCFVLRLIWRTETSYRRWFSKRPDSGARRTDTVVFTRRGLGVQRAAFFEETTAGRASRIVQAPATHSTLPSRNKCNTRAAGLIPNAPRGPSSQATHSLRQRCLLTM